LRSLSLKKRVPMLQFIVNLFFSEIKVVFSGTEVMAFVRNEKVPFLFNCEDMDMKSLVKRLFEKLAELKTTYLKVCLVKPVLGLDITAFSGDKESFRREVIGYLKGFDCRLAFLLDGSKRLALE